MLENIEKLNMSQQKKRRDYLVSEPNYHTTKFFTENVLAIGMEKEDILESKAVHLGLSILDLSKTLMYAF